MKHGGETRIKKKAKTKFMASGAKFEPAKLEKPNYHSASSFLEMTMPLVKAEVILLF